MMPDDTDDDADDDADGLSHTQNIQAIFNL